MMSWCLFEKIKSSTRSVSASSKTDTDLVNITLDAFMSEHFTSIDQKFGLLVNLDSMMSQSFHDSSGFGAL